MQSDVKAGQLRGAGWRLKHVAGRPYNSTCGGMPCKRAAGCLASMGWSLQANSKVNHSERAAGPASVRHSTAGMQQAAVHAAFHAKQACSKQPLS
eukprot:67559-Pelagomonas_calceolata.AAC.2